MLTSIYMSNASAISAIPQYRNAQKGMYESKNPTMYMCVIAGSFNVFETEVAELKRCGDGVNDR